LFPGLAEFNGFIDGDGGGAMLDPFILVFRPDRFFATK
jgi:hypothetical protein